MFTYRLTCPHCGDKHVEHRSTPYERNLKRKICPDCKRQRQLDANNGVLLADIGIDEAAPSRCELCKHWGVQTDEQTNSWYKACGRNRVSDVSTDFDEHQVYKLDHCEEWEDK